MRQINDMLASLPVTCAINGGALGIAFGVGMSIAEKNMNWLVVAVAGVLAIALGAMGRAGSMKKNYERFLADQETQDLTQALGIKHMDDESLDLIRQELKSRSSHAK